MSTSSCSRAYALDDQTAGAARDGLLDELGFAKYVGYRVEGSRAGRAKLNLAWPCCTTRSCCCSTSPTPA